MYRRIVLITSILVIALFRAIAPAPAQTTKDSDEVPLFEVVPATTLMLPGNVDSNSPAFWQFVQGQNRLHVLTSWWTPSISRGFSVNRMGMPMPAKFLNSDGGGKWFESVLQDDAGTLYGYYHNEPIGLCPGSKKTAPRIGAARSADNGASWEDLGIILEMAVPLDCASPNRFFVGGAGDFTVILDEHKIDAYLFFTNYSGDKSRQGVAVARMPWAQRNNPQGNLAVWDGHAWRYPSRNRIPFPRRWIDLRPIYPAAVSWHDRSEWVDSFWGPSVHWNTFLKKYVMLLNRASDSAWTQEGIYISVSPVLDDPSNWTRPVKVFEGGVFYPQVIGLERDLGTDKLAGSRARLFIQGRSDHFIVFRTREESRID